MSQIALIRGIVGQEGSYLAEFLRSKGYEIYGIVRRSVIEDTEHKLQNIRHILNRIHLHVTSLDNVLSIVRIIRKLSPSE
jgi:GDPmannose 4,6-dehydratase